MFSRQRHCRLVIPKVAEGHEHRPIFLQVHRCFDLYSQANLSETVPIIKLGNVIVGVTTAGSEVVTGTSSSHHPLQPQAISQEESAGIKLWWRLLVCLQYLRVGDAPLAPESPHRNHFLDLRRRQHSRHVGPQTSCPFALQLSFEIQNPPFLNAKSIDFNANRYPTRAEFPCRRPYLQLQTPPFFNTNSSFVKGTSTFSLHVKIKFRNRLQFAYRATGSGPGSLSLA